MKRILSLITMGALLPLFANDENLTFGIKVGSFAPCSGVLKHKMKTNAQLGIFAVNDLGSGQGLTTSFDISTGKITSFKDKKGMTDKDHKNEKHINCSDFRRITLANLGVSYTYHLNQKNDGVYLLAGVDAQHLLTSTKIMVSDTEKSASDDTQHSPTCIETTNGNKSYKHRIEFGHTIGVGYDYNEHLGVQLTYSAHNFRRGIIKEGSYSATRGVYKDTKKGYRHFECDECPNCTEVTKKEEAADVCHAERKKSKDDYDNDKRCFNKSFTKYKFKQGVINFNITYKF